MGSLDEKTISLFVFGDAYQKNCNEKAGAVFALFNCSVRKDNSEHGFSSSVYSAIHIAHLWIMEFARGKGKMGWLAQTYGLKTFAGGVEHIAATISRNLRTGFRDHLKSEGIYVVNPLADKTNFTKSAAPLKLLSVDGLKKALSNAGKVTTNVHSQGIRFLRQITGKSNSNNTKGSMADRDQTRNRTNESPSSTKKKNLSETRPSHSCDHKKTKMGQQQNSGQKPVQVKEKNDRTRPCQFR
ncbi:hypothetical protein RND71_041933 [Anisodus tanguticus]|uniref:MCM10 OB-fold domain-containing protein n=1 Tax=Anisodus tanguticus TaxID=243964 RepID=A0AAE1QW95_9SOLA|nr:hypothetical protein RND71_041933 [Anisodus tanguticus]